MSEKLNPNYSAWAQRPLEQIIILAENSESTDAIRLAKEIRRLHRFENKVKKNLEKAQAELKVQEAEFKYAFENDLSMRTNQANERMMELDTEIALLEDLLKEE